MVALLFFLEKLYLIFAQVMAVRAVLTGKFAGQLTAPAALVRNKSWSHTVTTTLGIQ